jgi:hypothetical protein
VVLKTTLSRGRRTVSDAVRLAATAPFFGVGMATMVGSLVVWWIVGVGTAMGIGIAVVAVLGDVVGFSPVTRRSTVAWRVCGGGSLETDG